MHEWNYFGQGVQFVIWLLINTINMCVKSKSVVNVTPINFWPLLFLILSFWNSQAYFLMCTAQQMRITWIGFQLVITKPLKRFSNVISFKFRDNFFDLIWKYLWSVHWRNMQSLCQVQRNISHTKRY